MLQEMSRKIIEMTVIKVSTYVHHCAVYEVLGHLDGGCCDIGTAWRDSSWRFGWRRQGWRQADTVMRMIRVGGKEQLTHRRTIWRFDVHEKRA